ncbi:MAG TPA: RNA 2',3'-cyclic phosphodiesterase [Longimicrobiales bacterium]
MRLFVAIDLPALEKQRLAGELERLAAYALPIRWLDPDSLHITVKFLGEVADSQRPGIARALRTAASAHQPFDLGLQGLGAFPSLSRPNVFWLGAQGGPALLGLQQSVETTLAELGFAPEDRVYRPHITVGKTKARETIRNRTLMDRMAGEFKYKATVRVETVELMRSFTDPRGARYEVLESVELH